MCEDGRLKLAMNLAFACSLRIGELLGLTWDCVDISPESIKAGKAYVYVNKELQRVSKSVMKTLEKKDVLRVFSGTSREQQDRSGSQEAQDGNQHPQDFPSQNRSRDADRLEAGAGFTKEALGSEYSDFDLVMANDLGMPTEQSRITCLFSDLIQKNELPKVVFHSLRHSSITYIS